jgi:hypothetical protein
MSENDLSRIFLYIVYELYVMNLYQERNSMKNYEIFQRAVFIQTLDFHIIILFLILS